MKGPRCWVDDLQPGDIVRFNNGIFRTVLAVSHHEGRVRNVTFPIRHCSWTGRGYTLIDRYEVRKRARRKAGHWAGFKMSPLVRKLLAEYATPLVRTIGCCEVIGALS